MSKYLSYIYLICIIFSAEATDYLDNYTVYQLTAFNSRERSSLYKLYIKDDTIFFLNGITNEAAIPMDVAIETTKKEMFERKLEEDDVQYSYNEQLQFRQDSDEEEPDLFSDTIVKFHSLEKIEEWCKNKAKLFPILEKKVLATTYRKKDLFFLKISSGKKRCSVFIIAGEEGRDWISPAVALNFVDSLLENPRMSPLLSTYDFYIIPVFNPDGYEYSRKSERFWAKNRNQIYQEKKCPAKSLGIGVNLDRNWFFAATIPYVADLQCYSIYGGRNPISEEETWALYVLLNKYAKRLMAFIDIRGFERAITIPYARSSELTNNHDIMMQILGSVSAKLKAQHNVTYFHGRTSQLLYQFTGNCADWVKKHLNVPVVYTVYLKDKYNFLPDQSEIKPLSDQFVTIANETLNIVYDIYGPLFNNKELNPCNIILYVLVEIIITILN